MSVGERIKKLRQSKNLTQQAFCEQIGLKRNSISLVESGKRNISDQAIKSICREFNVSEEWLRTGEGEMFIPAPDGALEALVREYDLSPGMYALLKRILALKPENQQAAVDFAVKLAEDLNRGTPAPPVVSKAGTTTSADPDIMSELAELKQQYAEIQQRNEEIQRQNQELSAEIAAMKEEDALRRLLDRSSLPLSVGDFESVHNTKK